jgi:hypothetical protein
LPSKFQKSADKRKQNNFLQQFNIDTKNEEFFADYKSFEKEENNSMRKKLLTKT